MVGNIPLRINETQTFSATKSYMPSGMYLHWHNFYEFDCIVSGKGTHKLNGNETEVTAGDVVLLSPTDFHEYFVTPENALSIVNIHFQDSRLPDSIRQLLWTSSGSVTHFNFENNPFVKDLFEVLLEESKKNISFTGEKINALLALIIIEIARKNDPEEERLSTLQSNRMISALIYIEQHFREQLKLSEIAEYTAFSSCYFSKIFHEEFGETFQSYLVRRRLEWSYSLITTTNATISDICSESGFTCLTYFERAFKAKYGISPSQYRKKVIEK